jgi:hypothetical protein
MSEMTIKIRRGIEMQISSDSTPKRNGADERLRGDARDRIERSNPASSFHALLDYRIDVCPRVMFVLERYVIAAHISTFVETDC